MDIGGTITRLRTEKGVYQKEMAASLKVSVGTISNYELGRHYPDPATLCKIADYFGVTTDYLLGRTSFRYDPKLLYRPFVDTYSMADLMNTSLELSAQNKRALIEYAELLRLKETTQDRHSSGL